MILFDGMQQPDYDHIGLSGSWRCRNSFESQDYRE